MNRTHYVALLLINEKRYFDNFFITCGKMIIIPFEKLKFSPKNPTFFIIFYMLFEKLCIARTVVNNSGFFLGVFDIIRNSVLVTYMHTRYKKSNKTFCLIFSLEQWNVFVYLLKMNVDV